MMKKKAATARRTGTLDQIKSSIDQSPWRKRFNVIYKKLRDRITLLQYPPGTRLDIDALAREFNVSRTPMRSVMQKLESEGLAITRHGVGTMVTEIDIDHVISTMELRIHLAELTGVLSPNEPDEALFARLEKLKSDCQNMVNSPTIEEFARIDMQLHDCKCQLIGNEVLRKIYDELYYRTTRLWVFLLPQLDQKSEFSTIIEDVSKTLGALRRNDIKGVGFLTRNFNSAGLFRIEELLREIKTPDNPTELFR